MNVLKEVKVSRLVYCSDDRNGCPVYNLYTLGSSS
ncbi:hypothetical protein SAMN05421809_1667 [Natronorubrum daqingense]|uniref:Uncharacterized protein n=1 Tax=Natronorubrum daqingense TaxID=588898 RepID=A0A1N7CEX7_9EURY|nr:hypothetical protein SAMN05421809_1667 [Natronorubrum daqingense]